MTRREALLSLGVMFALFTAGLTWLLGPFGLVACAVIGTGVVVFCFERVSQPRGEDVADAIPRELLEAFRRDLSL